jgi:DNA-binding SARP family transcriptional activator/Flp pilus assembly protein TadD
MDVQLLGPVRLCVAGRPVGVGVRMQRFVLAVLALEANRLVTTDRLIELTWPDRPPATARRIIHTQISRLRATLAGVGVDDRLRLRSEPVGYLIEGDRHGIDVHRFTALLSRAAEAADGATRLAVLDQALGLWRGPALAGATDETTRAALTRHLEEARWTAMEDRLDALLRQGRYEDVIADAGRLAAEHPFRHRFTAQLMLALHHAGRSVDALATYRQARRQLTDEFGLDPPAELQQLELAILRNEPPRDADPTEPPPPQMHTVAAASTPVPAPSPTTLPGPPPVPRQLPAPPQLFTGRAAELADLDQVRDASTVVVTAIDGMAGIGKTALAVQAAHRLADRYPDGQLFIDLHGYTRDVKPVEPAEALDRILRALGIPGALIPTDLDQRAALYRTRLADQRMLILLDNAATEAQVVPLLPGAPGCLVLVTSRHRLTGMDHTHTLSLDTLPTLEAIALFAQTAGESRLASQPPELLVELVQLCGRLPLALRIAATRLRAHPTWHLSQLVQRLSHQQHRLGELEAGQRSVTAALDLSYQHLSADQQQAYRLLGRHPGPEFDAYATAALLDATLLHGARMLDQLLETHLLQEPTPGRFRFHDLTRAHAASSHETEPARHAASDRLLDYYRHTAAAAMDAAYPYERTERPQVPPAHTPVPDLTNPAPASGWLDTELPNLLAAARYATEHGRPVHVLHLSTILHRHLRIRGRYHDAETLHQQALATAHATGDQAGQLTALNGLGDIHWLQGRHTQAADHYQQALQLARTTSNRAGEINALYGLGHIHLLQGRHTQAADHYQQAMQKARTTSNRAGEMNALYGLGEIHRQRGRYQQAADHHRQALQIARTTGHHIGEMNALIGLGHIHLLQGRHTQAADHYRQALQLARTTSNPIGEMNALNGLGHIHRRQGSYQQAADQYRRALQLARTTGHRAGELDALYGLGHIHRRQGRYQQAADHYQQLLTIAQESGVRNWQFEARQGIGRLQLATDHPDAAIASHELALALAGELNQPDDQARAHDGLAHAHYRLNQYEQANRHWHHAVDILTSLGIDHTEDEETTTAAIRAHLAALAARLSRP